jgi:hypothetical protein
MKDPGVRIFSFNLHTIQLSIGFGPAWKPLESRGLRRANEKKRSVLTRLRKEKGRIFFALNGTEVACVTPLDLRLFKMPFSKNLRGALAF